MSIFIVRQNTTCRAFLEMSSVFIKEIAFKNLFLLNVAHEKVRLPSFETKRNQKVSRFAHLRVS